MNTPSAVARIRSGPHIDAHPLSHVRVCCCLRLTHRRSARLLLAGLCDLAAGAACVGVAALGLFEELARECVAALVRRRLAEVGAHVGRVDADTVRPAVARLARLDVPVAADGRAVPLCRQVVQAGAGAGVGPRGVVGERARRERGRRLRRVDDGVHDVARRGARVPVRRVVLHAQVVPDLVRGDHGVEPVVGRRHLVDAA